MNYTNKFSPIPKHTQKLVKSIYLWETAKIKHKLNVETAPKLSLNEVHSSFWDHGMRNYKDFLSWENPRDQLKIKVLAPYHTSQFTQWIILTNQYPHAISTHPHLK